MPAFHDFSNVSFSVYEKAIFHVTNNEYIVKYEGRFILKDNWREIAVNEVKNKKYPFYQFWLEFPLGIELLSKAVLIKHEVDIFSRKKPVIAIKAHRLGIKYEKDELESGFQIIARSNSWLNEILVKKEIKYVKQLSTGTLGNVYERHLDKLKVLTSDELVFLKRSIRSLAVHRRNNDMHFYFKHTTFIQDKDIPELYLPTINLLCDVFDREP